MSGDLSTFGINKPSPIKPKAKSRMLKAAKEMNLNIHVPAVQETKSTGKTSFSSILGEAIEDVNTQLHRADGAIEAVAAGDLDSSELPIRLEEADLAFRMMKQIQEKLLSAYEEIKRM